MGRQSEAHHTRLDCVLKGQHARRLIIACGYSKPVFEVVRCACLVAIPGVWEAGSASIDDVEPQITTLASPAYSKVEPPARRWAVRMGQHAAPISCMQKLEAIKAYRHQQGLSVHIAQGNATEAASQPGEPKGT